MPGILRRAYDAKWVIFGVALMLLLLWVVWPFITVIVYAIFIYYIAKPIKHKLRPYIKNESLLVAACMFLLVLPLLIIIGYTALLALSQFNAVVTGIGLQSMSQGPLTNMSTTVSHILQNLTMENVLSGNINAIIPHDWYMAIAGNGGSIAGLQQLVISTGMTIADIIFKVFLIVIIAFYLLRDDDKLKAWVKHTFPSLLHEHDGMFVKYYRAVDEDLEKIFFGNILSIVFFAIVAAFIFSLLNVFAPPTMDIPYPILMGILCGVSALVPVVGMYLVTVPMFLYILAHSLVAGTFMANIGFFIVMVAAVVIFVQTLPEFVLRPFMSQGQVNTGLLMFAYIIGPVVFGIAGLFIAAIALVLLTHYFRIVLPSLTHAHNEKI
ncbi:MAG TPA: AI-2E family transporter [Methanocella sp.]|uniref:AI-2E family transporter n=1 Tax=Methanocella sp. TaxID=2052833 RepID=UPI002C13937F|nr:AI-2E family transporter [Methanocella sp.]HTY91627.1 AI-2E family transporter [Methanocella sp.]